MLAPSSDLLRTGVGLKLNQVKRATRSYLRDRTNQATGTVTSYAIAAGLFGAAGVFFIAACLVGIIALFRWVELNHGMFPAFGAVGGLLVVISAMLAGIAALKLRRPAPQFPSLASRWRVALTASPIRSGQIEEAKDGLYSPTGPADPPHYAPRYASRRGGIDKNVQAGLAAAALLLGWVAARRLQQARRTEA